MAKCPFCNAEIADTAKFCTNCGAKLEAAPKQEEKPAAEQTQQQTQQQDVPNRTAEFQQMKSQQQSTSGSYTSAPNGGTAAEPVVLFPTDEVEGGKLLAILGYLFSFLFFLPLVVSGKKTSYGMFHANQQLMLFIVGLGSTIVKQLKIPLLSGLVSTVASIFCFVVCIMGIVSAYKGTQKPLPLIGKVTILK